MKTINRTLPVLFETFSRKIDPSVPPGVARIRLATFETIDLYDGIDDLTQFQVADWNAPELRALANCAAGLIGAPVAFFQLVEAMQDVAKRDDVPPTVAEEGLDAIDDHFTMLKINIEDGDSAEAMLQNCAALVAAANRMAAVLIKDIPPGRLVGLIRENQP